MSEYSFPFTKDQNVLDIYLGSLVASPHKRICDHVVKGSSASLMAVEAGELLGHRSLIFCGHALRIRAIPRVVISVGLDLLV
jgi:hypothetical protein